MTGFEKRTAVFTAALLGAAAWSTASRSWAQQPPAVSTPTATAPAAPPAPTTPPSAAAPPAAAVPSNEKADYVGAETCLGCHTDHAKFKQSYHARYLQDVKKIEFSKSCETCHGPGSLHAAAGGDKTNPGWATIRNPAKLAPEDAAALCLNCHKQKKITFWGTSAHRQNGLSCEKCHSVHDGHGPKMTKTESSVETCAGCHKKQNTEMQLTSHHPIPEGKMACTGCHNPHGGEKGNLNAATVEDTCFKCHADKAGPYQFEHPPVVEECTICHRPHGSPNNSLLKQDQPFLCLRCHKAPHVAYRGKSPNSSLGDGHNALSVSVLEQRGRCTDCHREIHGSDRSWTFKN